MRVPDDPGPGVSEQGASEAVGHGTLSGREASLFCRPISGTLDERAERSRGNGIMHERRKGAGDRIAVSGEPVLHLPVGTGAARGRKRVIRAKANKAEEPKPATIEELQSQVNDLTKQARELKDEVFRLRVERDVLEKAAEVIKKEEGVSLGSLTNRDKAVVIDALRNRYNGSVFKTKI